MKNSNDEESLVENFISEEEIFDGVIMHVYRDTVKLPNGNTATREYMKHVGAVCVVPIDDDGNVIIERQFRYPIRQVITEIPAGKLNNKEEDRLDAAKRELEEETGIKADKWINLGDFYPAAAYSDERLSIYMATSLHYGKRHLDDDEFLNIEKVPLESLVQDVMQGKITDAKTQVAILKCARIFSK